MAERNTHIIDPEGDVILFHVMEGEEHRIRVSTKHLIRASQFFAKVYTGREQDSTEPWCSREFLPDFEGLRLESILILMRIIHGQASVLPEVIDLPTLVDLGLLVDRCQCAPLARYFALQWVDNLTATESPSENGKEVMEWIYVAWVWNMNKEFEANTLVAVETSYEMVHSHNLPLPGRIIERIKRNREQAIAKAIRKLKRAERKFLKGAGECCSHFSSIMLGYLQRNLYDASIKDPMWPKAPYIGESYKRLVEEVESFVNPEYEDGECGNNKYDLQRFLKIRNLAVEVKLKTFTHRSYINSE
ncbi:hypothetical protein ASPACDRAFT_45551 [Aspergillus aculeatus ATCC 16872]|uniref:BTB domain-containing protein n=1 Tax=Aspergillus aculeatus (strain ATCC 16872 / CBS 172.66 / WB 5094) TaxID=690307 RepID=A0A1L9WMS7_ASPA1|nr:uncharacterized protein ASPACDRAFT_45551 [Aspergillus aculeatus ATCC 16872]OJJ97461.1 hypothetical protein ASPACDRAFT_45551 [Aspergillus aculeatus ATCC 16872]